MTDRDSNSRRQDWEANVQPAITAIARNAGMVSGFSNNTGCFRISMSLVGGYDYETTVSNSPSLNQYGYGYP